jgi:hypothetical protein
MVEHRLDGLAEALVAELAAVDQRVARMGGVLQAKLRRVHADLLGEDVERALHRKIGDGRARRPVGRDLRPVRHHVVAGRLQVGDGVTREAAEASAHHRRAGKGAGLIFVDRLRGGDRPVLLDADLHGHRRAGGRPARLEHLVATHGELDRVAGLLRQHHCHRLDIDHGFGAEAAADLGRVHLEVGERNAAESGGVLANDEMALGGTP